MPARTFQVTANGEQLRAAYAMGMDPAAAALRALTAQIRGAGCDPTDFEVTTETGIDGGIRVTATYSERGLTDMRRAAQLAAATTRVTEVVERTTRPFLGRQATAANLLAYWRAIVEALVQLCQRLRYEDAIDMPRNVILEVVPRPLPGARDGSWEVQLGAFVARLADAYGVEQPPERVLESPAPPPPSVSASVAAAAERMGTLSWVRGLVDEVRATLPRSGSNVTEGPGLVQIDFSFGALSEREGWEVQGALIALRGRLRAGGPVGIDWRVHYDHEVVIPGRGQEGVCSHEIGTVPGSSHWAAPAPAAARNTHRGIDLMYGPGEVRTPRPSGAMLADRDPGPEGGRVEEFNWSLDHEGEATVTLRGGERLDVANGDYVAVNPRLGIVRRRGQVSTAQGLPDGEWYIGTIHARDTTWTGGASVLRLRLRGVVQHTRFDSDDEVPASLVQASGRARLTRAEVLEAARAMTPPVPTPPPSPPHTIVPDRAAVAALDGAAARALAINLLVSRGVIPATGANLGADMVSVIRDPGSTSTYVDVQMAERSLAAEEALYELRGLLDGRHAGTGRFIVRARYPQIRVAPEAVNYLIDGAPVSVVPVAVDLGGDTRAARLAAAELATGVGLDALGAAYSITRATWAGGRREGDVRYRQRIGRAIRRRPAPAGSTADVARYHAAVAAAPRVNQAPVARQRRSLQNEGELRQAVKARCTVCEGDPYVQATSARRDISAVAVLVRFECHGEIEEVAIDESRFLEGGQVLHDLFLPEMDGAR